MNDLISRQASFENHGEIKSYAKDTIYRQDAINAFTIADMGGTFCYCDSIVETLKNLPSAQPDVPDTNVGDMISRQASIQTAERMYKRCDTGSIEDYHDLMIEALTALPSAQPCDGCKWEGAIGYGECHQCMRAFGDKYEKGENP